jgi:hypothetical protein
MHMLSNAEVTAAVFALILSIYLDEPLQRRYGLGLDERTPEPTKKVLTLLHANLNNNTLRITAETRGTNTYTAVLTSQNRHIEFAQCYPRRLLRSFPILLDRIYQLPWRGG